MLSSALLAGNSLLLRVLPALYEKQPQPMVHRLPELLALMGHLQPSEQQHLLRLLQLMARRKELGVRLCVDELLGAAPPSGGFISFRWLGEL